MTRSTDLSIHLKKTRFSRETLDKVLLIIAYLLPFLYIFDENCFESISLLLICFTIYFSLSKEFFALYPLFFFFYNQLVAQGDIVVYRVYTVIFILRFIYLNFGNKPRFRRDKLGIFALLAFASLLFLKNGYFIGIGTVIDICFMFCFIYELGDNRERLSVFFSYFVFAACISSFVGLFLDDFIKKIFNTEQNNNLRYLATLEDPNYLGFYLNVAIAIVLLHPLFKKLWLKLPSLLILYLAILASGSVTALLANIITLAFCFIILICTKRISLKLLPLFILVVVICVQLWELAPQSDWLFISKTIVKWQDKFESLFDGELSNFSTSRTDIWQINMDTFSELPLKKQLFGGNYITALGRNNELFNNASHQEYLDIMLSTGIFGLIWFLICVIFMICNDIAKIKSFGEIGYIKLTIKFIWLFYAFGLTMFMNTRFYILLLI